MRRYWAFFIIISTLVLGGCTSLFGIKRAGTPVPTEQLPTLVALTVEARRLTSTADQLILVTLASPTSTPEATPTLEIPPPPTATPSQDQATPVPSSTVSPRFTASPTVTIFARTLMPTPTATLPDSSIQIRIPGPMSKVTSPLVLRGSVKPGQDGRIQIELVGEDGQLLLRKVDSYPISRGWAYLSEELDFEINGVAEIGRLQISTYDEYNRQIALESVGLILLSMGEDDLNPPLDMAEPIVIDEPRPFKLIQGGWVWVSGKARVSSQRPLIIELIDAAGKVVGYRQADVTPLEDGVYSSFGIEVPYEVKGATWVRLSVKEISNSRIEGVLRLASIEIMLSP